MHTKAITHFEFIGWFSGIRYRGCLGCTCYTQVGGRTRLYREQLGFVLLCFFISIVCTRARLTIRAAMTWTVCLKPCMHKEDRARIQDQRFSWVVMVQMGALVRQRRLQRCWYWRSCLCSCALGCTPCHTPCIYCICETLCLIKCVSQW